MKKKGFTFIELVLAAALVVVLVAILTPVFVKAKWKASEQVSVGKMKKLHAQVVLYRADWDTGGYESISEMGLPSREYVITSQLGFGNSDWVSPCSAKQKAVSTSRATAYMYWPSDSLGYMDLVDEVKEQAVMFADLACADPKKPIGAKFLSHRVLGIRLSGEVVNVLAPGDPRVVDWWRDVQ
jgi:prepilin-type N-terminal cleavage/methylation domain-containing protein